MGWTVLYIAFGIVALWLLGEVLLQYKARLRWRLLAFVGFLGVVLGVLIPSVLVIALGAAAFAVGQTYVTLSFRRGFAAGWAVRRTDTEGGRRPVTKRRRGKAERQDRRPRGLRSGADRGGLRLRRAPRRRRRLRRPGQDAYGDDDFDRDDVFTPASRPFDPTAAGATSVYEPQPLPDDTGSYGIYSDTAYTGANGQGQSRTAPGPVRHGRPGRGPELRLRHLRRVPPAAVRLRRHGRAAVRRLLRPVHRHPDLRRRLLRRRLRRAAVRATGLRAGPVRHGRLRGDPGRRGLGPAAAQHRRRAGRRTPARAAVPVPGRRATARPGQRIRRAVSVLTVPRSSPASAPAGPRPGRPSRPHCEPRNPGPSTISPATSAPDMPACGSPPPGCDQPPTVNRPGSRGGVGRVQQAAPPAAASAGAGTAPPTAPVSRRDVGRRAHLAPQDAAPRSPGTARLGDGAATRSARALGPPPTPVRGRTALSVTASCAAVRAQRGRRRAAAPSPSAAPARTGVAPKRRSNSAARSGACTTVRCAAPCGRRAAQRQQHGEPARPGAAAAARPRPPPRRTPGSPASRTGSTPATTWSASATVPPASSTPAAAAVLLHDPRHLGAEDELHPAGQTPLVHRAGQLPQPAAHVPACRRRAPCTAARPRSPERAGDRGRTPGRGPPAARPAGGRAAPSAPTSARVAACRVRSSRLCAAPPDTARARPAPASRPTAAPPAAAAG